MYSEANVLKIGIVFDRLITRFNIYLIHYCELSGCSLRFTRSVISVFIYISNFFLKKNCIFVIMIVMRQLKSTCRLLNSSGNFQGILNIIAKFVQNT